MRGTAPPEGKEALLRIGTGGPLCLDEVQRLQEKRRLPRHDRHGVRSGSVVASRQTFGNVNQLAVCHPG